MNSIKPKSVVWIKRVEDAHKKGIINKREKEVLVLIEEGVSMAAIGRDLRLSRQRIAQMKNRGERIVRTGKPPKKGRPPAMPEEYVIKLTRRQKDSLRNKGLREMILKAEAESQPYWTHCLMSVLDQIAEQNNTPQMGRLSWGYPASDETE